MGYNVRGARKASSKSGPELPSYMTRPTNRRNQVAYEATARSAGAAKAAKSGGAARGSGVRSGAKSSSKGNGNGGGQKKRTRAQRLMRFALIAFIVLIAVVAGILLLNGNTGGEDDTMLDYMRAGKKFSSGVTIEGVDVGGKTIEEARPHIQQAVNASLNSVSFTISDGDKSWSITSADMNPSADLDALIAEAMGSRGNGLGEDAGQAFYLEYTPNRTMLLNRLNAIASEVNTPPIEPHMVPSLDEANTQSFKAVEGQNGRMLNVEQTADKVAELLKQRQYQNALEPVYDVIEPTMSLALLKENTRRISSYTTEYDTSGSDQIVQNRCFNIAKAAGILNCHVVQPGEEFSFNDLEGPRTTKLGWKEANGISGGKEYTLQAGGGICQVSTTLYNALLRGNIPITDRKAHSIPSSYVKKGLDATVDTNGIDLKFQNDTGMPIYIFAYVTKHESKKSKLNITISLYGKPLPEGVRYELDSEIIETIPRDEIKYIDDPTLPIGYEMEVVKKHDGFVAKVFRMKYENDKPVGEPEVLYEDKYRGNVAEVKRGTGDPAFVLPPEGAVYVGGGIPQISDPGTVPDTGFIDDGGVPDIVE